MVWSFSDKRRMCQERYSVIGRCFDTIHNVVLYHHESTGRQGIWKESRNADQLRASSEGWWTSKLLYAMTRFRKWALETIADRLQWHGDEEGRPGRSRCVWNVRGGRVLRSWCPQVEKGCTAVTSQVGGAVCGRGLGVHLLYWALV